VALTACDGYEHISIMLKNHQTDSTLRETQELPVLTDVWGRPAGCAVIAREVLGPRLVRCDPSAETAELPAFVDSSAKRVVGREMVVARVAALLAAGKVSASVVQRRLGALLRAL
jgi:hypothetical protein